MFLINVINKTTPEESEKHIKEHREFLDKCYEMKKLVLSGRTVEPAQGFIMAYNCSRIELENLLKEDPLHVHDLVEYRITEFKATKFAKGLEAFI